MRKVPIVSERREWALSSLLPPSTFPPLALSVSPRRAHSRAPRLRRAGRARALPLRPCQVPPSVLLPLPRPATAHDGSPATTRRLETCVGDAAPACLRRTAFDRAAFVSAAPRFDLAMPRAQHAHGSPLPAHELPSPPPPRATCSALRTTAPPSARAITLCARLRGHANAPPTRDLRAQPAPPCCSAQRTNCPALRMAAAHGRPRLRTSRRPKRAASHHRPNRAALPRPAPIALPRPAPIALPRPSPIALPRPAPSALLRPAPIALPRPSPIALPRPAPSALPRPAPSALLRPPARPRPQRSLRAAATPARECVPRKGVMVPYGALLVIYALLY
ncbi:hypothetical protein HWV62_12156 [Athelia sp. TMB]|nr:hypothetical protein HWV62_12156 [Athelia sp. TMB]